MNRRSFFMGATALVASPVIAKALPASGFGEWQNITIVGDATTRKVKWWVTLAGSDEIIDSGTTDYGSGNIVLSKGLEMNSGYQVWFSYGGKA